MEQTLKVQGMTCGHCKKSVMDALMQVDGVKDVKVCLEKGEVDVSYNSPADEKQLAQAVEEQGYDVV